MLVRVVRPLPQTAVLARLALAVVAGSALAEKAHAAADSEVDGVTVTGARDGYKPKAATSSSKLPLSLRETPQSITVITRQRIEDFNMLSIANVLEQTTGITVQENDSNRVNFTSRGFSIANFQMDGVPTTYSSGNSTMSDTLIYDRVEVVRGATGLVTGSGDPSATVNLIRKQPTRQFTASIGVSAGSWDMRRLDADVSGPIFGDKVRARLVAGFDDRASHIDFYETKKAVLYGVVEADITASTLIRVGYDYQQVTPRGTTWGTAPLYYRDGTPTDLPRSYNVAARWSTWDRQTQNAFGVIEQKLPGDWVARAAVNYRVSDSTALLYYGYGGYPDRITGAGLTVADYYNVYQEKETGFDGYVTGSVAVLGRRHEVVFGANGYDRDGETLNDNINAAARPYAMTIPDFRTWDGRIPEPVLNRYGTRASVARTTESGVYGALRLNPVDGLKIIAGVRSSHWKTKTDRYNLAGVFTNTTGAYAVDRVTPYFGAVYDISSKISAYASYSDLFKPQSNRDKNNELLNPVVGSNFEGGLKGEFFGGRLYAAAQAFYVKQDNLAEVDPTVPDGFRLPDGSTAYRAVSGAKTRGAEVEVAGSITDSWRISGGYTYAYTDNAKGLRINTLNPRNIVRVYTTYDLPGAFDRLTIGGGVNWQSEIYTTATIPTSNTTTISSIVRQKPYALVSLMARYKVSDNVGLTANVENLLDKTYYRRVGFYNGGYFGEPRRVTISVRARF